MTYVICDNRYNKLITIELILNTLNSINYKGIKLFTEFLNFHIKMGSGAFPYMLVYCQRYSHVIVAGTAFLHGVCINYLSIPCSSLSFYFRLQLSQ